MNVVANIVLTAALVYVSGYTLAKLIIIGLDKAGLVYRKG